MMKMRSRQKRVLGIITLVLLILLVTTAWYVYDQIGDRYSHKENRAKFAKIPYYDSSIDEFISPEKLVYSKEKTTGGDPGFMRFFKKSPNAPQTSLPKIKLSRSGFSKIPADFAFYWFGHSTALIELDGKRLLIDPVFENAGPLPGITARFDESPVKKEDLPEIDVLIITHDHYDHLETNTIKYFAGKDVNFVVPLGVGARLKGWGVPEDKVIELAWHQSYQHEGIGITATPGVHYSGRSNKDRNKTLWASYVIKGKKKNIFWSGDTGYSEHFKAIGTMYGPFNIAFVEIDAWNKGWPNTHLFPEEVIKVISDVKAEYLFPIHLATFDLALHPWKESIQMVSALADSTHTKILTPVMGQKTVPGVTSTTKWWKDL